MKHFDKDLKKSILPLKQDEANRVVVIFIYIITIYINTEMGTRPTEYELLDFLNQSKSFYFTLLRSSI